MGNLKLARLGKEEKERREKEKEKKQKLPREYVGSPEQQRVGRGRPVREKAVPKERDDTHTHEHSWAA